MAPCMQHNLIHHRHLHVYTASSMSLTISRGMCCKIYVCNRHCGLPVRILCQAVASSVFYSVPSDADSISFPSNTSPLLQHSCYLYFEFTYCTTTLLRAITIGGYAEVTVRGSIKSISQLMKEQSTKSGRPRDVSGS